MNIKKLLFVFGTRPEAIKIAPLIKKVAQFKNFEFTICLTGQHQEMLSQVLEFFDIIPHFNLNLMKSNQDLSSLLSQGILKLSIVIDQVKPDLVIVQGDTTSALIGGLVSFHKKIKVAHIEAGLRSGHMYSPFPEEMNRKVLSILSYYHFVPTKNSMSNLYKENIKENIYIVGNTVIDALKLGLNIIRENNEQIFYTKFYFLDFNKKIILITCHRRENFGLNQKNILEAVKFLSAKYLHIQFLYIMHPNPNVTHAVKDILSNIKNIFLVDPLSYPEMIWIMSKSYFIITDSGGIQEEAPSLNKPVLITRDTTERVEVIEIGAVKLVGTNKETIVKEAQNLIENSNIYDSMINLANPYGDGTSSEKILNILNL